MLGLTPFIFQFFSTVADRYVYLSMLGVALLASWATRGRMTSNWAYCGVFAAALLLGVLMHRQSRTWESGERLFRHAIAVNSDSFIGHDLLGDTYRLGRGGNIDRAAAEQQYLQALRLRPNIGRTLSALAHVRLEDGRPADALPAFAQAAANLNYLDASFLGNWAIAAAEMGQADDARACIGRALAIDRSNLDAAVAIAVIEFNAGRRDQAAELLNRVLAASPDHPSAIRIRDKIASASTPPAQTLPATSPVQ